MKRRKKLAIATRQTSEMVSLLLPVSGKQLMLPCVSLAEILPLPEIRPVADRPNWLLGVASWREQEIPLISFEGINDEPFAPAAVGLQLAVVNGTRDVERLPFYGIALQSMPKMSRVAEEDLRENPDIAKGVAESMAVFTEGAPALIPDLEYIESQLLAAI